MLENTIDCKFVSSEGKLYCSGIQRHPTQVGVVVTVWGSTALGLDGQLSVVWL